jgi:hypothetical protein
VTVTQIHGLRACREAGIHVPKEIIDKACRYIATCATSSGGIAYSTRSRGAPRLPITAAAVSTMYYAGQYDHPVALKALAYLKKNMDYKDKSFGFRGHFSYAMMYACQAMYLSDAKNWSRFYPAAQSAFKSQQALDGSWPHAGTGPVFGTAVAVLSLQLPYAYLPIFQR